MKRSYLFTSIPKSLLYYICGDNLILMMVLLERENSVNKTEKSEWFKVPTMFFQRSLGMDINKKIGGSQWKRIKQTIDNLVQLDLIEYENSRTNKASKFRIKWETIENICKTSVGELFISMINDDIIKIKSDDKPSKKETKVEENDEHFSPYGDGLPF